MKKRILPLLLCIMLVVGMMPTTAFAGVTGTWEVKLNVSESTEYKYNGQNTLALGFGVQSDDLKLKTAQTIVLAIDLNVLDFLQMPDSDVEVYNTSDTKLVENENVLATTAQNWIVNVYCCKSSDGKTGYMQILPSTSKNQSVATLTNIATVYLGFKSGKSISDLTSTSIRLINKAEAVALEQSSAVMITDGNTNTQNAILADDSADTLKVQPKIVWDGITPTKPAYSGTIDAPTVKTNAGGKVELNVVTPAGGPGGETVQYGYSKTNDGKNITWQDGTIFKGLDIDDTLYFYAKVEETAEYQELVSAASTAVKVADKPAASVATAPTAKSGLKYNGSDQVLLGFMGAANGGTMQYSLDNSTWSTDIPKGKDAKTYTVYYKAKGDSSHSDSAVANVSVTIDPKDISSATIGTIASQSYTGSAITPDSVVTDSGATLVKGTDYTVSCIDNIYVGTNTAKLTITGKGNYTGTKNANFTINAIDQTPTFNTPASLVKGGRMLDLRDLVNGAKGDMTFIIASGTAANLSGYTLTSTGITGDVKINVSITAKDVDGDGTNEYNAFSKSEAITVKVVDKTSDTTTMKVSQDDITYGGSVSPAVTNKPADTGTVSYTYEGRDGTTYSSATAPTNVGKYKVKATCESSTTIYTAEDNFEILPKSISGMTVTLDKNSLEYNGSAQTVNVTSVGSLTATDYTVTSGNSGTDVSSYTVTVTGKGNYKDTAKATWQITPATLTVTPNTNQSKTFNEADPALTYTYSGNASSQTPAFTGALNRAAGEDVGNYAIQIGTLALKDNGAFKAANYTMVFAGATVNFEIQKADFTSAVTKTVDILKNQTTAQSGTLTVDDFFTGTKPAEAKITAVTPASATMMNNVSVEAGTLKYTSNTNITATSNEAYTVTITTKNYNDIHATLTFQPTDKGDANVSITGVPTASVTYGDSFTLNAEAANEGTGTGTWKWSSSAPTVLEVTGSGTTATVKVLAEGNAAITAKYESDTTVDTETTAAITAVRRVISVKADDKSMTVNAALPIFTVTYGNFASGDTANAVFAAEAVASTTADGKTTGTFDITITTAPTLKTEMVNKYEVGTPTKGILKVNPKSSGGGSYVPTVQKPEITIIGSGKADLSADGRTATITANAGHELVSVVLNGKEMGKVEKLTGLKTGDKATITFKAKTDGKAEMDKMIAQKASKLTLMARSAKTAKLNIKVVVKGDLKAITDAGYTVKYKFYRSTKKSAGYKAVLTKKAPTYVNTYGKKGTMYYYKARVMIYDKDGNFVAQTALKQCKYANRLWTK